MKHVLVGVDSSRQSIAALAWAVDSVSDGDVLELVHVWNLHAIDGFEMPALNPATFEVAARKVLDRVIAEHVPTEVSERVDVRRTTKHGHPGETLVALSESADLVVVGRRGLGGFRERMLGSVSNDLVHHAGCPVVIVPST